MNASEALSLALQHHQAGRLREAEALYRQVLSVQPDHADALHHLGLIAHQVGRHELAIELIRKAVALNPGLAAASSNLGETYRKIGRLDEAIASYRRAVEVEPDAPNYRNNLGIALAERGQLDEALTEFRQAVRLKPDYVSGWYNLGNTYRETGRLEEAVEAYRRTLELNPRHANTLNNLGLALLKQERLDESVAAYRQAIEIEPRHGQAWFNLGNALKLQIQLDEAIAAYQRALQIDPRASITYNNLGVALGERARNDEAITTLQKAISLDPHYPAAHNNLGNAWKHLGHLDEAASAYRRALDLRPEYMMGRYNLANVLREQGWLDEAAAEVRHAIRLQPDHPESHATLGNILKDSGSMEEALEAYRRSAQLQPSKAAAFSMVGYALHFCPGATQEDFSDFYRQWNEQFADPLRGSTMVHANDRDPDRRLRIGYVSPDFRQHVVGRNLIPLFRNHNRDQFEIVCYSDVLKSDDLTEEFRRSVHRWRNIAGLGEEALASAIREDGIDILVDLTQHMAENRLALFARRPAPVQVSFAGYPATAGLEAIGYRISDRYLESEIGNRQSTEQILLLDNFWCYDPCGYEAALNDLPALKNGYVTFGSLNNFCKINDTVLRLWARVMQASGESRLIVLSPEGHHRQRALQFLETQGVDSHRVEFIAPLAYIAYLELHHRLDIALDPLPYNGHTTSLDALWMGIPVISLAGATSVSRAGLSQLSNLGLPELAAYSEEEYIRLATELACDLPRLADLRSTLRPRMKASPLMDAPRFAGSIEAAFRTMWKSWCTPQKS